VSAPGADPRSGVVVIGAGAAGLATALDLAPLPVTVLSVAALGEGAATGLAQGGIAAAIGPDDDPAAHAADTLAVACGLADPAIVTMVATAAPACIEKLAALGVPFDRDARARFRLGREAGHGRRRILHAAGDGTGDAILRTLVSAARAAPSITVLDHVVAEALILADGAVVGVTVRRGADQVNILSHAVVLATGGLGGLFRHTTNPIAARGQGLALAARAGAILADMEFVQFHPTALAVARDPMPLITEALRGEGAVLVDDAGRPIMTDQHPMADLAPRDIVARAVARHRRDRGPVYLDARKAIGPGIATRFPTVDAACRAVGLDPAEDPIPVAPAAHYHMGGVAVDGWGRSTVPGLWAVGEVAATGLHGANRLASNSLLEAIVFAGRAATDIKETARPSAGLRNGPVRVGPGILPASAGSAPMSRLRRLMSNALGLERDAAGLCSALTELRRIESGTRPLPRGFQDAILVARFMATAALRRRESRGAHFRSDWPSPAAFAQRTFLGIDDLHDDPDGDRDGGSTPAPILCEA